MKIKLINGTSFKMFPRQYESVEVSVGFEIEQDVTEENFDEKLKEMSKKIKEVLKSEIDVKTAEYLVKAEKMKRDIKKAMEK